MRIAVCISGQVRNWKQCYQNWVDNISPYGEVDYFCHFWDYNSNVLLDVDQKQDIIDTLKPKKILFEPKKIITYWNSNIPKFNQFDSRSCEQLYSTYYSSLLKKEYELENNFRYDVVLQLRPNLCFLEPLELETPIPNTIYTYDSCQNDKYGVYKVSDKFFYGDSHTVDQVSEFFKFLSFIDVTWITWKKTTIQFTPTEIAFYYYMTNIGILNHPTKVKIA